LALLEDLLGVRDLFDATESFSKSSLFDGSESKLFVLDLVIDDLMMA
jgi:hypothetical protein